MKVEHLNAGDLDQTVELQSAAKSYDGSRQPVLTWSTFATRRAKVSPVAASEKKKAGGKDAVATHEVVMRRYGFVKHDNRVVWAGGTYQILGVVNDKARDSTTLLIAAVEA